LYNLKIIKGFLPLQEASIEDRFNKLYIALRLKEERIYSDKEVLLLPKVLPSHRYFKEWNIRSRNSDKLSQYINRNGHVCNILEVGCGNGWLSAKLSTVATGKVTGIDINMVEMEQARKVFGNIPNLRFMYGDIRSDILQDKRYDLIVFAASIQYFPSLDEIIKVAQRHLTLQGEIHILDSPLYRFNEISEAKQRSKKYYTQTGFPEMSVYYFHHSIEDLRPFKFSILYNPHALKNKLRLHRNPFHWIVIKNSYF
jgi:ubiquinone/menaquinone biosynthesis C-methylase UbiE